LPHPLTDGDVDRRSILHEAMAAGVKDPSRCEVRSRIANLFRNEFNDPPPAFERFVLRSGDAGGRVASGPVTVSTWRNLFT
jgi:hypothetical protein